MLDVQTCLCCYLVVELVAFCAEIVLNGIVKASDWIFSYFKQHMV